MARAGVYAVCFAAIALLVSVASAHEDGRKLLQTAGSSRAVPFEYGRPFTLGPNPGANVEGFNPLFAAEVTGDGTPLGTTFKPVMWTVNTPFYLRYHKSMHEIFKDTIPCALTPPPALPANAGGFIGSVTFTAPGTYYLDDGVNNNCKTANTSLKMIVT